MFLDVCSDAAIRDVAYRVQLALEDAQFVPMPDLQRVQTAVDERAKEHPVGYATVKMPGN